MLNFQYVCFSCRTTTNVLVKKRASVYETHILSSSGIALLSRGIKKVGGRLISALAQLMEPPSREHCRTGTNTGKRRKVSRSFLENSVIARTQRAKAKWENSRGSNWIKEAPAFHRSLSYSTSPRDPGRCLVNVENVPHLLSSPATIPLV